MITIGTTSDISLILDTANACIEKLHKDSIFQWNENYPNNSIFLDDIENKNLYLIKDKNQCLGIIVINEIQDKKWNSINWPGSTRKPLIIHRLIIHPDFQNSGLGKKLMTFAINYAKKNNFDSIRFDAYSGNKNLIDTYEKYGCKKYGEVIFPYRELPFFCYEFPINSEI